MPNYDEVIQKSEANLKALSEKLKDLDKLHQDIKELIRQPEIFDIKFQQIVKLSDDYTKTLGTATKKYLDGNNTLFTTKLNELSDKTKDLQKEISRLVNIDFTKLFQDLQISFIDQTRKDLAIELKKFEEKLTCLQTKIDDFKKQVERLENIDLEKYFGQLQKTLSEIFGAINSINLTLTAITQSLNNVVQSLGVIQNTIDNNHKETKQLIGSFSDSTAKHLSAQDDEAKRNIELLESKINSLEEGIELLKKGNKVNKIIQIVSLITIVVILILLAVKL